MASLQSDVEGLVDNVLHSDLEDELKRVLVDGLETVRNALLGYRVFGAEGIRMALDRNFAWLRRYQKEINSASQCKGNEVLSSWIDILGKLEGISVNVLKLKQLADPIIGMLGAGGE